jgi:calcium-dependent protein kinase
VALQNRSDQITLPYFTSPEVLKNDYNSKCDLYSIGVILSMLLTGRAPIRHTNFNQYIQDVLNGRVTLDKQDWV